MLNKPCVTLILAASVLAACTSPPSQRQQQSPPFKQPPSYSEIAPKQHHAHAKRVVAKAHDLIGMPYARAGTNPKMGFDCSGLVMYVYQSIGIALPRTTGQLINMRVPKVLRHQLQLGDLVYFATKKNSREVSHVGIYVGDGVFIHAASPGKTVQKSRLSNPYWHSNYLGANRPLQPL